eukprot:Clim_evm5s216 gene=Clim_evmTU5s216
MADANVEEQRRRHREKRKQMLQSFYGLDHVQNKGTGGNQRTRSSDTAIGGQGIMPSVPHRISPEIGHMSSRQTLKREPSKAFDDIDGPNFDPDAYLTKILNEKPLSWIVSCSSKNNREVKELDADMQNLVYENYNRFITATDKIHQMKDRVGSMGDELESVQGKMNSIEQYDYLISGPVIQQREEVAELAKTHSLLTKMQFLFDLPEKLKLAVEMNSYRTAVDYYVKASVILKRYKHLPSFRGIATDSESIIRDLRHELWRQLDDPTLPFLKAASIIEMLVELQDDVSRLCDKFFENCRQRVAMDLKEHEEQETKGAMTRDVSASNSDLAAANGETSTNANGDKSSATQKVRQSTVGEPTRQIIVVEDDEEDDDTDDDDEPQAGQLTKTSSTSGLDRMGRKLKRSQGIHLQNPFFKIMNDVTVFFQRIFLEKETNRLMERDKRLAVAELNKFVTVQFYDYTKRLTGTLKSSAANTATNSHGTNSTSMQHVHAVFAELDEFYVNAMQLHRRLQQTKNKTVKLATEKVVYEVVESQASLFQKHLITSFINGLDKSYEEYLTYAEHFRKKMQGIVDGEEAEEETEQNEDEVMHDGSETVGTEVEDDDDDDQETKAARKNTKPAKKSLRYDDLDDLIDQTIQVFITNFEETLEGLAEVRKREYNFAKMEGFRNRFTTETVRRRVFLAFLKDIVDCLRSYCDRAYGPLRSKPKLFLLSSKMGLNLANHGLNSMVRILDTDFPAPKGSGSDLSVIKETRKDLKDVARSLITIYTRVEGIGISDILRRQVTSRSFHCVGDTSGKDGKGPSAAVQRTIEELQELYIEANNVYEAEGDRTAGRYGGPGRSQGHATEKSNRYNYVDSKLLSSMHDIFAEQIVIYEKIDFTSTAIVRGAVKIVLKCLSESIRTVYYDAVAYRVLKRDLEYITEGLSEAVNDEGVMKSLAQECLESCASRCIEPVEE